MHDDDDDVVVVAFVVVDVVCLLSHCDDCDYDCDCSLSM